MALASLDAGEKAAVLDALLRTRTDLNDEAESIARRLLVDDVDPDAIAEAVEWDLRALSIEELHDRAGPQRGGGYVEPTEAAWELLEEAVQPHASEIGRLLALGFVEPAVATVLGVVAGLHRCRDCEDGDLLLSWAPDFPAEHARWVLKEAVDGGCELPPKALCDSAPTWADWIETAGLRKQPRRH